MDIKIDTLILYAYHESPNSAENLKFFLRNGKLDAEHIKFVIIVQGDLLSVDIPDTIDVIYKENHGLDFEAWSVGLDRMTTSFGEFDWYIFINDTVRGPFVPRWFPEGPHWTRCFTDKIDKVEKNTKNFRGIKIVGITCSYDTYLGFSPHIQSMMWVTDKVGLEIIKRGGIICDNIQDNKREIIRNYELKLTRLILEAGYDFYAMNASDNKTHDEFKAIVNRTGKSYKDLTNNKLARLFAKYKLHGDIHYPNKYFGHTISPFETMFIKTNRINTPYVKLITNFY